MQWNDIYIGASAAWLGRTEDVVQAVTDGRYEREEYEQDDYVSVRVSDKDSPAEMAVAAAKLAIARAELDPQRIGLLLQAGTGYQGLDHWTPGLYVLRQVGGDAAPALEVRQACSGGMTAIELAAAYLTAGVADTALITTSDRYAPPAYDRYRTEKGILQADGATGLVLSREPGIARLLSTRTIGDSSYEGVGRGLDAWQPAPDENGWPIMLRNRTKEFLSTFGGTVSDVLAMLTRRQQQALGESLKDANLTADQIAWYVFPNVGRTLQDWEFRKREFGIEESRTTWHWGRTVGHIGAGDQVAALTYLIESGRVGPGDKVALSAVGGGYQFSSAVVEIAEAPNWTPSAS